LPTNALVTTPKARTLVDRLAEQKKIASETIGAAGTPSLEYEIFAQVRRVVSPEEMVALLHHESPIVRGYAAQHVAEKVPGAHARLAQLLDDASPVTTMSGCMIFDATVGTVALMALCYSASNNGLPLLKSIAKRRGPNGDFARNCIAELAM
jgi:hypothetical protein